MRIQVDRYTRRVIQAWEWVVLDLPEHFTIYTQTERRPQRIPFFCGDGSQNRWTLVGNKPFVVTHPVPERNGLKLIVATSLDGDGSRLRRHGPETTSPVRLHIHQTASLATLARYLQVPEDRLRFLCTILGIPDRPQGDFLPFETNFQLTAAVQFGVEIPDVR